MTPGCQEVGVNTNKQQFTPLEMVERERGRDQERRKDDLLCNPKYVTVLSYKVLLYALLLSSCSCGTALTPTKVSQQSHLDLMSPIISHVGMTMHSVGVKLLTSLKGVEKLAFSWPSSIAAPALLIVA